jgi:hypothetical protein
MIKLFRKIRQRSLIMEKQPNGQGVWQVTILNTLLEKLY